MPVTEVVHPGLTRAAATDRAAAGPSPTGSSRGTATPAFEAMTVPYHVELRARRERGLRLEIQIDRAPPQPRVALSLDRSVRHGASLAIAEVAQRPIQGRSWQRTRFLHANDHGHATGIEYAAVAGEYLYRVTAYGASDAATDLAERVEPTLRLDGTPGPTLATRPAPDGSPAAVQRASGAVVAVVALDLDGAAPGRLTPVAMGSGVVVDAEGRVLTSLHTLHDQGRDAMHDLFLIGRTGPAGGLMFACAGRPAHGRLERALDLALIRCELDLSGDAFAPSGWVAIGPDPAPAARTDAPLWVLGFAETDDGVLQPRAGRALGPSHPGAGPEQGFAIDVAITPGMSGGAVVDEHGALIGVVQGFRERFEASSAGIRDIGRIGLVRPARQARSLTQAR